MNYTLPSLYKPTRPVGSTVPDLARDPARMKLRYTGSNGVDPKYAQRTQQFNRWLYTPADRRGAAGPSGAQQPEMTAEQVLQTEAPVNPANNGWQVGNLMDIAARYGGKGMDFYTRESARTTGATTGSAGYASWAEGVPPLDATAMSQPQNIAQQRPSTPSWFQQRLAEAGGGLQAGGLSSGGFRTGGLSAGGTSSGGLRTGSMTPEGNTDMRRRLWMAEGGSSRTLRQAQVAAGIRPRIDARARPALPY